MSRSFAKWPAIALFMMVGHMQIQPLGNGRVENAMKFILNSVISTSLMLFLLLYPKILGNGFSYFRSSSLLSRPPSHVSWILTLR